MCKALLPHVNKSLVKRKPLYDPVKDLEPIASVVSYFPVYRRASCTACSRRVGKVGKGMPVTARCPSGNPGAAWSDVMANAASAEEQSAQQVEAAEKDSPLLDPSDAAVKGFIKTAKARGYVTYNELNAVLPSEEVSSEQIEDTMSMLSDMGITVVDSEDHGEGVAAPNGEDEADDDDAGGRALAIATPVPAITQARTEPAERTDDPVRMYLRDMGSVELLSREGEIAIAKRIEAGRVAMIAGLCESPLTFQAIIIWRDELMNAKILLRDIIDLEATYEGPE